MHRVTAVVFDPELKRVEASYKGEIVEFTVPNWYMAFDKLIDEWKARHPSLYAAYGIDDIEVRAITMIRLGD